MKKRIISLILCAAVIISACGCSADNGTLSADSSSSASAVSSAEAASQDTSLDSGSSYDTSQTLLIKQAPISRTVRHLTVQTSKTTRPMLLLKRQSLRQTSRKPVLLPLRQASPQTTQVQQQTSLRLQPPPIPPKSLPQRLPQQQ